MKVPKQKLKEMYRMLLGSRIFGDKLYDLYVKDHAMPWYHEYLGEEAVSVAAIAALKKGDYVKLGFRMRPINWCRGVPFKAIVEYELGTNLDPGIHHACGDFAPDFGILGISGSLGEDIPIYTGAALSAKLQKLDRIAVCIFGDGTASRGPVHEGMNMAAVMKIPIVFICQNNGWAITTPVSRQMAVPDLLKRAEGYGMPAKIIDGNDMVACYEAVKEAVDRVRKGDGPSFIEAKTSRRHGHFVGDMQEYRSKEDIAFAKESDPVPRYKKYLMDKGLLTEEEHEELSRSLTAEIDKAIADGQKRPAPKVEDLAKWAVDTI